MATNTMIWIIVAVVVAIGVVAVLAFLARNRRRHAQAEQHSRGGWTRDTASREARGIRGRDRGEGAGSPGRGRGEGGGSSPARRNSRFPSRRCEHLPRGPRRPARARRCPRPQAQRCATAPRAMSVSPTRPKPGRGRPKRRPPSSDTGCDTAGAGRRCCSTSTAHWSTRTISTSTRVRAPGQHAIGTLAKAVPTA